MQGIGLNTMMMLCRSVGPDKLDRMSRGILTREQGAFKDSLEELFG